MLIEILLSQSRPGRPSNLAVKGEELVDAKEVGPGAGGQAEREEGGIFLGPCHFRFQRTPSQPLWLLGCSLNFSFRKVGRVGRLTLL